MQTTNSGFAGLITDLLTSSNILIGQVWQNTMLIRIREALFFGTLAGKAVGQCVTGSTAVDLGWYAPNATDINDLSVVVNGTDTDGFIYNTSVTPATSSYSTYNWCNMPHVRRQEYITAPKEYKLEYVELVRRCLIPLWQ